MRQEELNKEVLRLYDHVKFNLIEEKNYLNLGYWRECDTLRDASKKLIELVIDVGKVKDATNVLDVGCGYAAQDIQMLNQFPHLKISAINIVSEQVDYAKSIIDYHKLDDSIQILNKNANTILSFKHDVFDRIISIESAFHFNTRKYFLQNSHTILKQNGIICIVDILQDYKLIKETNNLPEKLRMIAIPEDNIISIQDYNKLLQEIGYKNITILDISNHVIPYAAILLQNQKMDFDFKINLAKEKLKNQIVSDFMMNTLIHKYCIIYAEK